MGKGNLAICRKTVLTCVPNRAVQLEDTLPKPRVSLWEEYR